MWKPQVILFLLVFILPTIRSIHLVASSYFPWNLVNSKTLQEGKFVWRLFLYQWSGTIPKMNQVSTRSGMEQTFLKNHLHPMTMYILKFLSVLKQCRNCLSLKIGKMLITYCLLIFAPNLWNIQDMSFKNSIKLHITHPTQRIIP